jgi:hypothetical protein
LVPSCDGNTEYLHQSTMPWHPAAAIATIHKERALGAAIADVTWQCDVDVAKWYSAHTIVCSTTTETSKFSWRQHCHRKGRI